jgi:hypothetical protein
VKHETNQGSERSIEEDEGSFEDPLDGSRPYPSPILLANNEDTTTANDDHGLSRPLVIYHSVMDVKMLYRYFFLHYISTATTSLLT